MTTPLRERINVSPGHRTDDDGGGRGFAHRNARLALRLFTLLAFACALCVPAVAQPGGCADSLRVEGVALCITFSAAVPAGNMVQVRETLSAAGKSITHEVSFELVPGARASRTIDDVDISSLVPGRSLHTTLKYSAGKVTLDRALLLPGAIPLR
jgi:hypothetical protein